MARNKPVVELDPRYSEDGVPATEWTDNRERLENGQLYLGNTVRRDGRPHTTPAIAVWLDDALYFSTRPTEQKAKNIAANAHCIVMTGCNPLHEGMDVVV